MRKGQEKNKKFPPSPLSKSLLPTSRNSLENDTFYLSRKRKELFILFFLKKRINCIEIHIRIRKTILLERKEGRFEDLNTLRLILRLIRPGGE